MWDITKDHYRIYFYITTNGFHIDLRLSQGLIT